MQVSLIPRRDLQNPGFDLGKTLFVEPCPDRLGDGASRRQEWPDVGVPCRRPPWRKLIVVGHQRTASKTRKTLASTGKISMLQHETASLASGRPCPDRSRARISGKTALKVIASSIRKGIVILQASYPLQRRAHARAAAYRDGNADRDHDRGRLVRRARQGLVGD